MTIKEIALEILYKYEEAQQIIIDEYSVNFEIRGKQVRRAD